MYFRVGVKHPLPAVTPGWYAINIRRLEVVLSVLSNNAYSQTVKVLDSDADG